MVSQRDRQLRGWVTLGRLTDEQARLARSLWAIEGDSAWVSPVPEPRQLWYCGPVVEAAQLVGNGAAPAMQETNGHGVSATKSEIEAAVGVVLMIARPNMTYQLSSGRAYTADWAGRLATQADDIGELRAQGCRVG